MKFAPLLVALLLVIPSGALYCASSGDHLQSGSAYSAGVQPNGIVEGDFNRDGNADLLVIDDAGGSVTRSVHVMLGKGDGTFQTPIDSTATPNLSAIAVGDFNGDGIQDIAVTDSLLDEVMILIGNGDGTFSARLTLPTAASPSSIAAADLNGDGTIDLAVANSNNTLNIYLGTGDGTFTLTSSPQASTQSGGQPVALTIGDFDGDHKPDIAVALNLNAFGILKGNGDGTFGAPRTTVIPFFTNPRNIAAVDLNSDGALDLVVLTNKVLFLAGNNNLTFKNAVAFNAGEAPNQIAIGDVNNDGAMDIVVTNAFSESISVLLNDGHGGISNTHDYATVTPTGVALGDFNGDGKLDVASCGAPPFRTVNNIQLLLGTGDGRMRGSFVYYYQTGGSIGSSSGAIAADVNNDGRPDIIAGDATGRITILLNSGDFNFTAIQPTTPVATDVPGGIAAGKMTNSGNMDVVVASRGAISVLPGFGDGTFLTPIVQMITAGTHRLALGDLNGDGKLDVAFTDADGSGTAFGVLLGNGDGTFKPLITVAANELLGGIAIADFNGDGKPDIAVSNAQGGRGGILEIMLGKGDGTFTQVAAPAVGVNPATIVPADFNHDGKIDLAVVNTGNGNPGSVSVLLGNGDGTFQAATDYPLPSGASDLTVGDFNADGSPDFAVSEGSGMADTYINHGDGTFSLPGRHFTGPTAFSLFAIDLNGGGGADLIAAADATLVVIPNAGGTHLQLTSSLNPSVFPQPITLRTTLTPSVPGTPSPGGSVHFARGNSSMGDVLLSAGSASISFQPPGAGAFSIQASYAGDANFFARPPSEMSQVVNKAATSVLLNPASLATALGDPLSLNVSVAAITSGTPTGTISLLDGTSVLASSALNSAGATSFTISQLSLGTHSLTAAYLGDSNYQSGNSAPQSEQVSATPDFLISSSSLSVIVRAGQAANVVLSVSPTQRFTGPMTFSCSGLPSLAACSFNPSTLPLNGTTTFVTATITTTASSMAVRLPQGHAPFPFSAVFGFIAASVACMIMLWRKEREVLHSGIAATLLLLLVTLVSCAGGGNSSSSRTTNPGTPPGASSIVISGSAPTASGSVSHQFTLTLTVTP